MFIINFNIIWCGWRSPRRSSRSLVTGGREKEIEKESEMAPGFFTAYRRLVFSSWACYLICKVPLMSLWCCCAIPVSNKIVSTGHRSGWMTNDTWAFLLPTANQGCFNLKGYRRYLLLLLPYRISYKKARYDSIIALKHDTHFKNRNFIIIFIIIEKNRFLKPYILIKINVNNMNTICIIYKNRITFL